MVIIFDIPFRPYLAEQKIGTLHIVFYLKNQIAAIHVIALENKRIIISAINAFRPKLGFRLIVFLSLWQLKNNCFIYEHLKTFSLQSVFNLTLTNA